MRMIFRPFVVVAAVAGFIGFAHTTYAYGRDQGRAAAHELDGGNTIDPVVASDHASPPAPVVPDVDPGHAEAGSTADDLTATIWDLWERGLVTPALMLLFHMANTIALARWSWLASLLPWLANGRWLAVVSAIQGATTGLVPLAVADDLTAAAIAAAFLTAFAQYFRPTPTRVTVATTEAAEKIEPMARAVVVKS